MVKNTFIHVKEEDDDAEKRVIQSFPAELPSAKEAVDKAAARAQEAREEQKEEAAPVVAADPAPAVVPAVAAALGPPTVQGAAPCIAPFGGGAFALGTGQAYGAAGSWLHWGQPPVNLPVAVDHSVASYRHDFGDSLGMPQDVDAVQKPMLAPVGAAFPMAVDHSVASYARDARDFGDSLGMPQDSGVVEKPMPVSVAGAFPMAVDHSVASYARDFGDSLGMPQDAEVAEKPVLAPVGGAFPAALDHSVASYAHDYGDSLGLPQDPYSSVELYEGLDGTNEATTFKEHLNWQNHYKDQAKQIHARAESLRQWVKQLEDELGRRNVPRAPASGDERDSGGVRAVGGPLPLSRTLSGSTASSRAPPPSRPPPPPPTLRDTQTKSEPHNFRAGEPAYVTCDFPDVVENHGAYSFPPFTKWGNAPPEKIDDFGRQGDGGAQTPQTASYPATATTSASSVPPVARPEEGGIFGSRADAGTEVRQPCDLGPTHCDDPEMDDMLGWAIPRQPPAAPPPPPPAAPPAASSRAVPAEASPDEAAEQYSFTVHASKFNLKDRSIVSKLFSVLMNGVAVPFLVQITASKTEDKKGGHSFQKAKGHGKLEVNCKKPPANGGPISISFVVGSETRGPVTHNFAESSLCGLAKECEEWDFPSAVDPATSTVTICVKIPGHKVISS